MRTCLTLLIALSGYMQVFSQEWKPSTAAELQKSLGKCSGLYRSENYALNFTMALYKNTGDAHAVTTNGSLIRGKGRQYRSEQPGKLVIQTDQVKLLVDSSQQVAGITQPDTLFDAVELDKMMESTDWEKLTITVFKTEKETRFRASGPSLRTYEAIEFLLDNKTGYLTGLTLDFRPYNYFSELPSDETIEKPRAVVTYSIPKKITADQQRLLDVSTWIKKSGDRYELVPSRSTYRLEDYRLPVHH